MSTIVQLPFSGFDPRTLPGCALWLDAADLSTFTLSGSSITQWNDKSGNARHAVGNTGTGTYSATALNSSLPGVQITATGNMRSPMAAGTLPSGCSVFVVYQKTGANQTFDALIGRSGATNTSWAGPFDLYSINGTSTRRFIGSGDANNYAYAETTGLAATRSTTPTIYHFNISSSAPTTWNESINGTTASYTLNITGGTPTYTDAATSVWLGTRGDGSTTMVGTISEVIIYNFVVTANQRQQVEGYLASKWGLRSNTPISHPYRQGIATRPFQPPDIGANLALWLDAADQSTLTLSSTNVTAWRDKSSNAYSFTGAVGGYPTYSNTLGGLPVVSSATGQRLSNTAWTTPSASATMFVVMRPGTLADNASCFLTDYPSGQVGFKTYYSYANQAGYYYYFQMFAAQNSSSGASLFKSSLSNSAVFVPTTTVLITANIQGGPAHYVRYNGTQTAGNILNDARSIVAATNATLAVAGAADNSSSGYDLAEFIIYDGTMTTAQIKQVEGYLATKWRVSTNIPTTEPYYNLRTLPATPLFAPVNVSNCAVWLDCTDLSTFTFSSGSNVSQWRDKTASIAFTCANITLTTLSNYPALSNSGTGYMVNTSLNVPSPYSMFVVANCASNGDTYQRLVNGLAGASGATQNNVFFMGTNTTNIATFIGNGTSFNDTTSNTPISNVIGLTTLYSAVVNGTSVTPYTNANQSTVKTGAGSAATLTGLNLGGGQGTLTNSGSQTWPGHVMELLLYSRQLSAIERQQVEGYLAWKWGLQTLTPSTHPFKNFRA